MPVAGFRRVTSGSPCAFCSMLASRGAVYSRRGADFQAHDGCSCSPEPVWEHEQEPPEVVELQRQWREVTAGKSGKDALRAWRRHVESGGLARPPTAVPLTPATGVDALAAAPRSLMRPESLSSEEFSFLRQYKGTAFVNINEALRRVRGDLPRTFGFEFHRELTGEIDKVMRRSRLTSDVRVKRGIKDGRKVFGARWDGSLVGAEWTEHSYLSTSADGQIAETFGGPDGAVLDILLPRGTGAIELSDSRYEAELLAQRGLRLRVVADTGPGPGRVIEVEAIR